eukprot:scaffold932_cov149-Cylindrotheca_fusiformis.AAC.4
MSSDSKNNDGDDKEEPTTASTSSTTDPPLKIVPDCWDDPAAVPTTTKASETIEEAVEEVKKEQLEPGDHVTRWEMLPIAWPIQVHGIVLNVHEGTVVLVDFGLSAPPVDKATKKASTSPTSPTSSSEEATISNTKKVEHAIRNFKIGGKKPEKNRLNINVLSNPKDIAKWKRVNYESGWFGGGGSKKNSKSKSNNKKKSNSNDEDGTSPTKAQRTKQWFSKMATSVKEKTRPGLDSLKEKATSMRGALHNHHQQQTESDNISTTSSTGAATETPIPVTEEEEDDDDVTSVNNNQEKKMIQPSESQDSSTSLHPSTSMVSEGGSSTTSDFSERPMMNSRMKELMQKKQEERPPKTMNPAMAKIMKKKKDEELSLFESKKKKSLAKLPKSDPVKLVLARTHWLLQHGESILPPYHAFSSNSECMAVFCKTGRWNTLQADVFLHSTAIGNAKTMGATTIAVAASAPMLAPAVAVAGIAAVASPWLYLNKQKNKAVDSQQRLTDEFWAQAEPEVFVACIQAWSKDLLGLKEEDDDEEDEEKNHHEKDTDDNVKEQETVMDIVAPPAVDVDLPEENAKLSDDVPPTD